MGDGRRRADDYSIGGRNGSRRDAIGDEKEREPCFPVSIVTARLQTWSKSHSGILRGFGGLRALRWFRSRRPGRRLVRVFRR